jgi:hypothetical protein
MSRLENIDGETWRDFLAAPVAVLVLGKTTCPTCLAYGQELESFLAQDRQWERVRFGKMMLDEGGLGEFKRASPWLAEEVDTLPFTQIYVGGVRWKDLAGGDVSRLVRRLETLPGVPVAGEPA